MSKFLSEVRGFTPVIDILARELGLMTAVVYGIAWRYCQMEDRVCSASRERIAEHAGISTKTVERHLKELCRAGYLEDLTPTRKHRPHIYADSGKAKIKGLLIAEVGQTESLTSEVGETESLPGQTQSPTRSDTESNQGKTESLIRIPSYDSIHEREEGEKEGESFSKSPDPLLFDLERQTLESNEGNYADPVHAGGDDLAAEAALATLYTARGSEPPLPDSNTYKLELEKVSQVLSDNGVTDPDISRLAAQMMCKANEESPKFVNPHFRSFPSSFTYHLGVAKGQVNALSYRRDRDRELTEDSLAILADRRAAQPQLPEDDAVGQGIKAQLEQQMSRHTFQLYVVPSSFACDDGALVITALDDFGRDWLESRLAQTIERTLAGVADGPQGVVFETKEVIS